MKIVAATAILKRAVHEYLYRSMARHLVRSNADLSCEASIFFTLSRAGFGTDSIITLRYRAADHARRIIAQKHKGLLQ